MEFAYGQLENAYLNIKEAAKEPWRGITAWVQGSPYLITDKDGDTFILEGEDGTLELERFDRWVPATDHSRIIAASRAKGSPFVLDSKIGMIEIGNLIYFEEEWNVRAGDSSFAVPVEKLVDIYDKQKWTRTAEFKEVIGEEEQQIHSPDNELSGGGSFDYQLPPHGIHFRTHAEMKNAGLTAQVHYPPGITDQYPEGFTSTVPGPTAMDDMMIPVDAQMKGMNPEDITVRVETPNDPEQVRQLFDRLGGRVTGKTAEQDPIADTRKAVVCPNCGSHTIRSYSPEGNMATLVCLTCGKEWQHEVHINPEASVKETAQPLDPNTHAQIVGLMQQIEEAYQQGNQALAQQLHQQMMQLMNNPNTPLTTQPARPMGSMDKGSPYPDDSYKNAPDHTPKGQKKWPKEVNAIYNACMREGNGKGDTKDEKESSCAAIAWSQYEKGKKKDSRVDNENLTDTTDRFFLESMTFEADTYDSDPYGTPQQVDLNQYQQSDPADLEDDRGIDYAHCPACDGPGVLLGQLGKRIHYRCRNCGIDFSHNLEPGDTDPNLDQNQGMDFGEGTGRTSPTYYASLEEAEKVNEHSIKTLKDSSGNPLEAGKMYTLHHPSYKVPDIVRILNLEDNRIEAAIASDEHGAFPIHITHDDSYSFDPYEEKKEKNSGWNVVSRHNFSTDEQKALIEENPKGKARNYEKLDLKGTHYQIKEEHSDPHFLLGW